MSAFCYIWGFAGVNWKDANWNWSECPTCITWAEADVEWNRADVLWSECTGSVAPPPPSSSVIIPVFNFSASLGIDAETLIQPWIIEPWNPYRENKNKIISLVCNISGKILSENKESKKPTVTVKKIVTVINNNENVILEFKKLE